MQKDPLISALVGALFLVSAATLALGVGYHYQARKARTLQAQFTNIQNTRMLTESLANDAVQYGKFHPNINPVLVRAGVNVGPQTPAAK